MQNEMLANHWQELVDLDGDEIFCYIPERPEFLCIEKTEEIIYILNQKATDYYKIGKTTANESGIQRMTSLQTGKI